MRPPVLSAISLFALLIVSGFDSSAVAGRLVSAQRDSMCLANRGTQSDRGVHLFNCGNARNRDNLEWIFRRQSDGTFLIGNLRGRCLAAKGVAKRAVHQWDCVARNPRNSRLLRWRIAPVGPRLVRLVNVGNGGCLAIVGGTNRGVHLWSCSGARNLRNLMWRLEN